MQQPRPPTAAVPVPTAAGAELANLDDLDALDAAPERRPSRTRLLAPWSAPVVLFILAAIVGPVVLPFDAVTTHTAERLKEPGTVLRDGSLALLGTDQVGRDMLAQVLQGARISLTLAAATVLAAGLIGLVLGVLAGYRGGAVDAIVMRLADIQLGFPTILLAILIASVLGPSVTNVVITLALTRWVTFGRVARASTLSAREREFVVAARALGASDARILIQHIVPSVLTPLIVIATVEIGLVIIAEASLSFLGLGVPSDQPSWGMIVANGRAYLNTAWWISTMPGLALSLVVLSVGAFGDRLRDVLDPRALGRG